MPERSSPHRAAPPPVRRHTPDPEHGERHRTYRPRKSNFSVVFGMLVAVAAVGIFALLALLGREEPPTFNELKQSLGVPLTGTAAVPDLDQVDFSNRLDGIRTTRQGEATDQRYLYLYYKVKEGQARITLDRGPWEVGTARIREIALR
jgi:hypothetical protein